MSEVSEHFADDRLASFPDLRAYAASLTLPADFLAGLPCPALTIPENILLFSHTRAFDGGSGTAHHRFVFIVNLMTRGSVIVDDSVHPLEPGQGIVVMPYQFHHYADFARDDLLWLFLTFELERPLSLFSLKDHPFTLTTGELQILQEIALLYTREGENVRCRPHPASGDTAIITHSLALLLEKVIRRSPLPEGGGCVLTGSTPTSALAAVRHATVSGQLLSRVAAYVYAHLHEPIQAEHVAVHAGLSVSHLRGRFKKITGIGIGSYIRRTRLHRACALIRSSEESFTTIAGRCGFESLYSFSRTFHHEMGMTPTRYREQGGAKERS